MRFQLLALAAAVVQAKYSCSMDRYGKYTCIGEEAMMADSSSSSGGSSSGGSSSGSSSSGGGACHCWANGQENEKFCEQTATMRYNIKMCIKSPKCHWGPLEYTNCRAQA